MEMPVTSKLSALSRHEALAVERRQLRALGRTVVPANKPSPLANKLRQSTLGVLAPAGVGGAQPAPPSGDRPVVR